MRRQEDKKIYELFDGFIKKFLIGKENFLEDKNEIIFNVENLKECRDCFENNPNEEAGLSFKEKVERQFSKASEEAKILFSHAIWLWGFSINGSKKCEGSFIEIKEEKIPEQGFANPGMHHLIRKYKEVCFCLSLFNEILKKEIKTPEEVKKSIEEFCLSYSYGDGDENNNEHKEKRSMSNVLLYLSNPKDHERIVSNTHKEKIVNCFNAILEEDQKNKDKNLEDSLRSIREKLSGQKEENFDFYDGDLYKIWNPSDSEELVDEYMGLKYKKSIVLYGPPGTSKTYLANQLAKAFIIREYLNCNNNGDGIRDAIDASNGWSNSKLSKYLRRLQLHENYGYENFIIGQSLENNSIVTKPGYFKCLCDEAINDKDHPYVLILDEINRINLGRLFGEVFSCIENRDETVELPYIDKNNNPYTITIPNNLYIIGTMNEIDFSLERIDFALRRRFLWFYHGYKEETLSEMLNKISNDEKDKFVERATNINRKIESVPELGRKYEIGHVIFSEINNLVKLTKSSNLYKKNGGVYEPIDILWKISIMPLLEAYLDNIDSARKKETIEAIENIYYGKNERI